MPHPTQRLLSQRLMGNEVLWWNGLNQRARRNMLFPFTDLNNWNGFTQFWKGALLTWGNAGWLGFFIYFYFIFKVCLCIQYPCVHVCLFMCESVKTCACFVHYKKGWHKAWPGTSGIFPFSPLITDAQFGHLLKISIEKNSLKTYSIYQFIDLYICIISL